MGGEKEEEKEGQTGSGGGEWEEVKKVEGRKTRLRRRISWVIKSILSPKLTVPYSPPLPISTPLSLQFSQISPTSTAGRGSRVAYREESCPTLNLQCQHIMVRIVQYYN